MKLFERLRAFILRENTRKFIQYCFVGGMVFVIHTGALWLFTRVVGMNNLVAVPVAYTIGAIFHFVLNNAFTFRRSASGYKKRVGGHLFVIVVNFFLNAIVVNLVLHFFDNVLLSTALSTLVTMLFGFLFLNKLVYGKDEQAMEGEQKDK